MESLLKSQSFDGHMEWIRQNLCYIAVDLTMSRSGHNFQFLYNPRDIPMTNEMFKRKVYSEDHLFQFIGLAEKHYGYHPEGGTFLDIGGNIGTTSIPVKKCFPKLDFTAFEPSSSNRKAFRINVIPNDCEDIRLVCCAQQDPGLDGILPVSIPE